MHFAAHIAIPNFEEAQKSFLDYMDNSTKLDRDRKEIKELFTVILRNEGIFTIAAKQITKILHQRIKEAVLVKIRSHYKGILLRLINQKIRIHGLVLLDVIAMLDIIDNENVNYIKKYFNHPFDVFKNKISHVFDSCQDIRLNDMIREKFDAAVKDIKQSLEHDLQTSCEKSLTEVMCQNQLIKRLGIGENDFAGILMPNFNGADASSTATLSNSLPENEDKKDIVKKLITSIAETDEVNTEIAAAQQEEIKRQVIKDASNHLFECTMLCPLCLVPCNETHSEREGVDSVHSSHCHRPQGFATYVELKSTEFITLFCNDLIKSKKTFRNSATKNKWFYYKDYKKVNSYYNSWNIKAIAGADSIYWKYITYHVTKNLDRYFPNTKKADVSQWGKITKSEAIKNINKLFDLDENTIARNTCGFHIIKKSEYSKSTLDFLGVQKNQLKDHNNIAETQSKYDTDNHRSSWRVEIQSYTENFHKTYHNQQKNEYKCENEVERRNHKLKAAAKKFYYELLERKEKNHESNVTNEEIEEEFKKFWCSAKENVAENPRTIFVQEIGEKYCGVPGYKEILEKFGLQLEKIFKTEWVEFSYVEFIEKDLSKIDEEDIGIWGSEFFTDIENLMTSLQKNILSSCLTKIKFRANSASFNCRSFVKSYLVKAEQMLTETHENRSLVYYNLTDTFKVLFLFFAAQTAIPIFEEEQKRFLDYVDNSPKLGSEREDIKQLFKSILKKNPNSIEASNKNITPDD